VCGLVAIVDPRGVPEGLESQGIRAISHRGPDGTSAWRSPDGTVAFAHARLAFTDLANGTQPFTSDDGRVTAIVNGEHYDDEPGALLAREGVSFKTRCDAELWPKLVARAGIDDACARWDGELAAISWEAGSRVLTAVRDRFGAKPLVWSFRNGRLLVASEARALFAMGVPRTWDVDSLRVVLSLQYSLPERSLFAGVNVLPPGHVLTWRNGVVAVRAWWSWTSVQVPQIEAGQAIPALREALEKSVRRRLRGERRVGALLSGGVDSASVAALAAGAAGRAFDTFTVSFDHADWDESALAAEQARAIGASHSVVHVGARDIVDHFERAIEAGENVAINGHVSAKWLLFREIRRAGVHAVLSGEGADELFLGYPHFRLDVDPRAADTLRSTNLASHGIQLPHGRSLPLDELESALGFVPSFVRAKATLGMRLSSVLRPEFDARGGLSLFAESHRAVNLDDRPKPLRSAWLWARTAFATSILRTLGDAQELAHGVEGRLPFLDPEVIGLASSMPASLLLRDGIEKWPLRQAVSDLVVPSIARRRKHPFMAPPLSLVDRGLARSWLADVLDSDAARGQPFIDPTRVLAAFDALDDTPELHVAWEPVFFIAASLVVLARGTTA